MMGAVRALLAVVALLPACVSDNLVACGDKLCAAGRACAPDGSCVDPNALDACAGHADGDACNFENLVGTCHASVCEPQVCGDGQINAPEECEGNNLNGATCLTHGFYEPDGLACSADCRVDTSACVGRCGDGIVNGPELCDTLPGDAFTCYEVGFDFGSVSCSPALCAPLYNQCTRVGWTQGLHNADYSPGAYAPKLGEVYIVNGGINANNYLHVSGSAMARVAVPLGCNDYGAGIWASSDQHVFLASSANVCEHVDQSWTMWPMPTGVSVERIWGTSKTDVYAVGSQVMHFDGATWTAVATGAPSNATFAAVHGRIGGTIAAVTTTGGVAQLVAGVWTYSSVASNAFANLWVSPSNLIYAFTTTGVIYTNRGGSWATLALPNVGPIDGLWGVSDTAMYVHENNKMWFYDGTHTTQVVDPDYYTYFGGGPDNVLAVGAYAHYWETSGYLWTPITAGTSAVLAVWAFTPSNIIALEMDRMLHFDGVTWTEQVLPFTGYNMHMWASSPNNIIVVGDSGLIETYDGTWHDHSIVSSQFNGVWGEAPDRVFIASNDQQRAAIYEWNGTTVSLVYHSTTYDAALAVWGSPTMGSYVLVADNATVLHLPPGADPTAWVEITSPELEPAGVWGDGSRLIVSYNDRQIFSYENATWTQIPARLFDAPSQLVGSPGALYGVSNGQLVHWGETWDRVRLPTAFGTANAVFAGNGVVAIGGGAGVMMLVQPR